MLFASCMALVRALFPGAGDIVAFTAAGTLTGGAVDPLGERLLAHRGVWSFAFVLALVAAQGGLPAARRAWADPRARRALATSTLRLTTFGSLHVGSLRQELIHCTAHS
jgi:hypothetical protein